MTEVQIISEIASGAILGTLALGGALLFGKRPHIRPKYTCDYGYKYKLLDGRSGPAWLWHWRASRECAEANAKQFIRHPLVYADLEQSVNGDTWRERHCHCGKVAGQYIEGRDRAETWFEQVKGESAGPVPAWSDDQAALIARQEYEYNYARAEEVAGRPGRWVGPDESGPRRFERVNVVERAGMAMGVREVIQAASGTRYVRVTCTRCGRRMSEEDFYNNHFTGNPRTLQCVALPEAKQLVEMAERRVQARAQTPITEDAVLLAEYERVKNYVNMGVMSEIGGRSALLSLASASKWATLIGGENRVLNAKPVLCVCGHKRSDHGDSGGACTYQEPQTADMLFGGPTGPKCACQGFEPPGNRERAGLGTGSGLGNDIIEIEPGEWEEKQACGCVIYRRLGGESARVCPTHGSGSKSKQPSRARIALDEEV
jgi:hypothetical protein